VEDMIDGSLHEPKAKFFKALNDIISTEEAIELRIVTGLCALDTELSHRKSSFC